MLASFLLAQLYSILPESVNYLLRWIFLIGTAVVGGALVTTGPRHQTSRPSHALNCSVVLLALSYSVSMMLAEQKTAAGLKLAACLLQLYIFIQVTPRLLTVADWRRLILGMEWTFLGITLLALGIGNYRAGRLSGIANPNSVGMIAMMATVCILWDATEKPSNRVYRLLCLVALVASIHAVWVTSSRSSMLGALGAFGIWGLSGSRRRWLIVMVIGVLAIVSLLNADVSQRVTEGYEGRITRGGDILASRSAVWDTCWRSWLERPWFGHGYGVSGINAEWSIGSTAIGMVRDGAGYAGLLESVGVFGVIALAVIYLAVWNKIYGLSSGLRKSSDWHVSMKVASLFIALSLHAVGEPWIIAPGAFPHVVFWMCFGYLASVRVQCTRAWRCTDERKSLHAANAGVRLYTGA